MCVVGAYNPDRSAAAIGIDGAKREPHHDPALLPHHANRRGHAEHHCIVGSFDRKARLIGPGDRIGLWRKFAQCRAVMARAVRP